MVEGALPAIALVFVLVSALWSAEVSFIISLISLLLLSVYLFLRKNWN
jgi:hypothetical protein